MSLDWSFKILENGKRKGFKKNSADTPRTQAQVLYWSETEDPVRQLKHTVLRSCARFYIKSNDRGRGGLGVSYSAPSIGEGKSRFHVKPLWLSKTILHLHYNDCLVPIREGVVLRTSFQTLHHPSSVPAAPSSSREIGYGYWGEGWHKEILSTPLHHPSWYQDGYNHSEKTDRLKERQTWLEEVLRQVKYRTNFLSDESQSLRSRRVVHKGEFTQLQGQRQRQPIIIYIRVFLFDLNCDYSNSLHFFQL